MNISVHKKVVCEYFSCKFISWYHKFLRYSVHVLNKHLRYNSGMNHVQGVVYTMSEILTEKLSWVPFGEDAEAG